MNPETIPTIAICGVITILIATICKIFINCMMFIALTIAKRDATINLKPDLIIIAVCTLTICLYFLI